MFSQNKRGKNLASTRTHRALGYLGRDGRLALGGRARRRGRHREDDRVAARDGRERRAGVRTGRTGARAGAQLRARAAHAAAARVGARLLLRAARGARRARCHRRRGCARAGCSSRLALRERCARLGALLVVANLLHKYTKYKRTNTNTNTNTRSLAS